MQLIVDAVWQVMSDKYDKNLANKVIDNSLKDFDSILADIPYIGGGDNQLTSNLYQSVFALNFYRHMQREGKTILDTGEMLYLGTERMMSGSLLNGVMGVMSNSELAYKQMKEEASISQERKYPDDWVFDFVSGKGKDFDYGIDYTECGICKYYKTQKAEELIPYMCALDFPISRAVNSGLIRTETLGHGGKRCDFRYKQGRTCQMEWVPEFLKQEGVK